MPELKLVYFPVQARGEIARYILEYGNIPYEDLTVQQHFGCGWMDAKPQAPFSQLPILLVDGKVLSQSGAIARYCASLVPSLVPSDPFAAAQCDAIYNAAEELSIVNPIVNMFRGDTWTQKMTEYFELFPKKLANLARALGDGPFYFGAQPSYCDFYVHHVFHNSRLLEPTCLDAHANVLAFMAAVEALPPIKEYLAKRPTPVEIGVSPKLEPPVVGTRGKQ